MSRLEDDIVALVELARKKTASAVEDTSKEASAPATLGLTEQLRKAASDLSASGYTVTSRDIIQALHTSEQPNE